MIDAVASPDLYDMFHIHSFPTVVLFRWGVEAGRMKVTTASEFTARNLNRYATEGAGLPTRRADSGEGNIEVVSNADMFFDLILDSGIQAQGMESADNRDVDDDISSENDVGTAATLSPPRRNSVRAADRLRMVPRDSW